MRMMLDANHPIGDVGKNILEEVRHLFTALAPDILLIEMTLASDSEAMVNHRLGSAPTTQVFVLRDYHNCAYVFGLLCDGQVTGLTERDALQIIAEIIQSELNSTIGGHSHQIVTKPSPRQMEDMPAMVSPLTAREVDVLQQLITGGTDRVIGQHLCISQRTVQYHLSNIYQKLGVKRRSEAIAWAIRAGLGEE